MPRRLTLLLILPFTALLMFGGGWHVASPYMALRDLRDAVVSGDLERLEQVADYRALRDNLKGQLRRQVLPGTVGDDAAANDAADAGGRLDDPRRQEQDPLGAFVGDVARSVGGAMIDRTVDALVTPYGLRVMLTGGTLAPGPLRDDRFSDVDVGVDRHGMDRFTARITSRTDAQAPPLVLGYARRGLGWRLVAVDLSSSASTMLSPLRPAPQPTDLQGTTAPDEVGV